jgi:phosphonate transport system permease protein
MAETNPPPRSPGHRIVPKRSGLPMIGALIVIAGISAWAFSGIQFDFTNFRRGLEVAGGQIGEMIPRSADDRAADIASVKAAWEPLIQTFQMAIVGTLIAAVAAFPVSFFAARTTSFFRPVSVGIKTLLNIGRAIPILIYALIVVAAIGLGPPAGTIALAFGTFVMLGKLYAEALESLAPGPIEAVKAVGGNPVQVFVFGMLPQAFPNFLSATLYAFELNIGASAILGIVGAGGIGFILQNDIRLFNMLGVGVLLVLLIVLVNIVDTISFWIRRIFS